MAGVYEHLPALMALTTPTPNSFRRLRPGAWCGVWRAWGYDHKEAPLRVPTARHGAPTNVELKSSDATANPYLALTGLIAAGLDGIERRLELPEPIDRDPGQMSDAERDARGLRRLPTGLAEALDELESNGVLRRALGQDLTRAYVAVKRSEQSALAGLSLADEVARAGRGLLAFLAVGVRGGRLALLPWEREESVKKILMFVAALALVLGTAPLAMAETHEGAAKGAEAVKEGAEKAGKDVEKGAEKAGEAVKKEAEKKWDGMSYKDGEKPGDMWDKKNPCAPKANPCAPKANPCGAKKNPCSGKK